MQQELKMDIWKRGMVNGMRTLVRGSISGHAHVIQHSERKKNVCSTEKYVYQ